MRVSYEQFRRPGETSDHSDEGFSKVRFSLVITLCSFINYQEVTVRLGDTFSKTIRFGGWKCLFIAEAEQFTSCWANSSISSFIPKCSYCSQWARKVGLLLSVIIVGLNQLSLIWTLLWSSTDEIALKTLSTWRLCMLNFTFFSYWGTLDLYFRSLYSPPASPARSPSLPRVCVICFLFL